MASTLGAATDLTAALLAVAVLALLELWLVALTVKVVVVELELALAAGVVAWLVAVEVTAWLDTVVVLVAWVSLLAVALAEATLAEVAAAVACELAELVVAACCGAFSLLVWAAALLEIERNVCTLLVVLALVVATVALVAFSVCALLAPVVSACAESPTVPKVVSKVTPEAKYSCFNFCLLYFLTICFSLVFFMLFLSNPNSLVKF